MLMQTYLLLSLSWESKKRTREPEDRRTESLDSFILRCVLKGQTYDAARVPKLSQPSLDSLFPG